MVVGCGCGRVSSEEFHHGVGKGTRKENVLTSILKRNWYNTVPFQIVKTFVGFTTHDPPGSWERHGLARNISREICRDMRRDMMFITSDVRDGRIVSYLMSLILASIPNKPFN
jgi:hypothetical protein